MAANDLTPVPNTPLLEDPSRDAIWKRWLQRLQYQVVSSFALATSTIGVSAGGTGITSYATGDILYASGVSTLARLAAGTSTQTLHGNSSGAPSWGQIDLTRDVSSTLPFARGGLGVTSFPATRLLYGDGTNPVSSSPNLRFDNDNLILSTGFLGVGAVPGSKIQASGNTNGAVQIVVANESAGASGYAANLSINDVVDICGFFCYSSGYSGTVFGVPLARTAEIRVSGANALIRADSSIYIATGLPDPAVVILNSNNVRLAADLAVHGGDLTCSTSSFRLINADVLTIQFVEAATSISLGATTGAITLRNATTIALGGFSVSSMTGNIMASTYTPTASSIANLDGITTFQAQYLRIANTVNVSGKVQVDPTLTATLTRIGLSVPVASNFGAEEDCAGTAFASGIAGQGAAIRAESTNDQAEMVWISGDISAQPMYYQYQYQVI